MTKPFKREQYFGRRVDRQLAVAMHREDFMTEAEIAEMMEWSVAFATDLLDEAEEIESREIALREGKHARSLVKAKPSAATKRKRKTARKAAAKKSAAEGREQERRNRALGDVEAEIERQRKRDLRRTTTVMILALAAKGMSDKKIADVVGLSHTTVRRWRLAGELPGEPIIPGTEVTQ